MEKYKIYCTAHGREEYGVIEDYVNIQYYGLVCKEGFNTDLYDYCPCCKKWYRKQNMVWNDDDFDEIVCVDCHEDNKEIITSYHRHDRIYRENKLSLLTENFPVYYGVEIELECIEKINDYRVGKDAVAECLSRMNDYFVYEEDGSLTNGFEMISCPFSKEFMDEYLKKDLKRMLDVIELYGYGTMYSCGLHFHISRTDRKTHENFVCLIEYFREEFILLSKRDYGSLDEWCYFLVNERKEDLTRSMIADIYDCQESRYCAVNLCNESTIEVRFFNGTADFKELMARYEMIYNIYEYARENELSEKLDNVPNFYELLTYKTDEYVTDYLDSEGFEEIIDEYVVIKRIKNKNNKVKKLI